MTDAATTGNRKFSSRTTSTVFGESGGSGNRSDAVEDLQRRKCQPIGSSLYLSNSIEPSEPDADRAFRGLSAHA
jgi:hypothetical protein